MAITLKNLWHIVSLQGEQTSDASVDAQPPTQVINFSPSNAFSQGTSANQVNTRWEYTAELAATSVTWDLTGGVTDKFGNVWTFTKVKSLIIANMSGTAADDLILTGDFFDTNFTSAGTFSHVLGPLGIYTASSPGVGLTVTADSADAIKLDAGAKTLIYKISVLGLGTAA